MAKIRDDDDEFGLDSADDDEWLSLEPRGDAFKRKLPFNDNGISAKKH